MRIRLSHGASTAFAIVLGLALGRGQVGADEPPPEDPPPAEDPAAPDGEEPVDPVQDDGGAAAALDSRVKKAIERGVAWLKTQQLPSGSFGELGTKVKAYDGSSIVYQHPIGPTAIALYAMLKCGVASDDPAIRRGFDWLRKAWKDRKAYENSVLLLAITSTSDPFKKSRDSTAAGDKVRLTGDWKKWALEVRDALLLQRSPKGWRYQKNAPDPGGPEDVSSTQLALLALHQAERCGLPIDPAVWADAIAYVLTLQEADGPETDRAVHLRPPPALKDRKPDPEKDRYGSPDAPPKDHARGFVYSVHPTTHEKERKPTGSRTACGVGSLLIARYALETSSGKAAARTASRLDRKAVEKAVFDGLAWLAANWSPYSNPGYGIKQTYYLYSVERVMDLLGVARLGEHLWYAEMAVPLLDRQQPKGFWDTEDAQYGARCPVIDTALALLFLHRATRGHLPVPALTSSDDVPPADNR